MVDELPLKACFSCNFFLYFKWKWEKKSCVIRVQSEIAALRLASYGHFRSRSDNDQLCTIIYTNSYSEGSIFTCKLIKYCYCIQNCEIVALLKQNKWCKNIAQLLPLAFIFVLCQFSCTVIFLYSYTKYERNRLSPFWKMTVFYKSFMADFELVLFFNNRSRIKHNTF